MGEYTIAELAWIALPIFLLGMSKGGFPVGSIALPMLILAWPRETESARTALGFMLPMLCCMDIVAMAFLRKHVLWKTIWPLMPGTVAGVIVASALFVSKESALISVSDKALKICIGSLGVVFTFYHAAKKWIIRKLDTNREPGVAQSSLFGFGAGLTSTVAHAAGPVMQMYLLPQKLQKMNFAATTAAFFFILNLVKMIPFSLLGRIESSNLLLGACILPVIPFGVALGYLLVRVMDPKHYVGLIYAALFITSVTLIIKAVA